MLVHKRDVRLDKGQNPGGAALVQFEHRQVLFGACRKRWSRRSGWRATPVATLVPYRLQVKETPHWASTSLDHVGHRGLAVGTGDADDSFGPGHPAEEIRA